MYRPMGLAPVICTRHANGPQARSRYCVGMSSRLPAPIDAIALPAGFQASGLHDEAARRWVTRRTAPSFP